MTTYTITEGTETMTLSSDWKALVDVQANDLRSYVLRYWSTYASCTKRKKTLEFNASGEYRVQRYDGTELYVGTSADAAADAYNE